MTSPEGSNIVVGAVEGADVLGLFDVLDGFLTHAGEAPLDEAAKERLGEAVAQGRIVFFAARQAGEVLGICSLTVGFSTYRTSPIGLMEDFFVVPQARGRGVGRLLVERLLAEASQQRCGSVLIGCGADQIPMYEHFGFKRLGTMMAIDVD